VGKVTCSKVAGAVVLFSSPSSTIGAITLHDINITFLTGNSPRGIDGCTQMQSSSGPNTSLVIRNVTLTSDVTTNLGNDAPGIHLCFWTNVSINGVTTTNTQGPAVTVDQVVLNGSYSISNVQAGNPGRTSTTANQVALRFINTSGNGAAIINIINVTSTGTVQYNIAGNVGTNQGFIDSSSLATNGTIAQWNWTGANMSAVSFPAAITNFRATGGAHQVVQQTALAGALSVGQLSYADISGQHNAYSILAFNTGNAGNPCTQNLTWFFGVSQCYATEANALFPVSQAMTLDKLYCTAGTAPPAGQMFTVTLRRNATTDTSVVCQFTNGGGTTCNSAATTQAYSVNDTFGLKLVNTATSGTSIISCTMRVTILSP
jgi:hypothetical protein